MKNNIFLLLSNILNEVKNIDHNFLLNLDKQKIPNISKIVKVPDIQEVKTKNYGTLFRVKYFLYYKSNVPRMIGFSSKDKSFSKIFSLDVYSRKLKPVVGFILDEKIPKDKLLDVIGKISMVSNLKKKPSGFSLSKIKENINESIYSRLDDREKLGFIIQILTVIAVALIPIMFLIYFYIKRIIHWRKEVQASTTFETYINSRLFIGQKEDEPAFLIYNKLVSYIKNVVLGKAASLIICGPPGMSKTYIVRRVLHFTKKKPGSQYLIEKGSSATARDVYFMLFKARKKLLILDDFDTPLKDADMVNFLKAVTDTYEKRIISMPREKVISSGQQQEMIDAPEKFEFEGKLIIITNLKKNQINSALLSRSPAIEINFDTKTVLSSIEKMLKFTSPSIEMSLKKEVYNYIVDLYKKDKSIKVDFRTFQSCIDARVGVPEDWKNVVNDIVNFKGK